ncbi:tripartite tricarboxylate transporter TctB family protein [Roseospira marina]|uniref:Tripartite tricarboxylate transporter TctB family protein n=1 Tax=Roseospira marina TaxID=140057 RepID=A0A5M6I7Q9_9PROT|nr:tripartite tricarboxylate transporter TctB family protein [Roseospira marina]KAA5604193.1 tripartite tricarboxylate transporter TctB family protein [Roseospira marina]MBB4315711.1 putative tricarboxylic transport membrane protein [Roseospira marina]MBB5088823.1 putative tricarboxylic transport membrane protein [Roseospira marina]
MVERRADTWIGFGLLATVAFMAWRTLRIPSVATGTSAGPDFIPWVMIGGIAVLSFVLIIRAQIAARKAAPDAATPQADSSGSASGSAAADADVAAEGLDPALARRITLRIFAFIALLVGYAAVFMQVGYLASTCGVFIIGMYLLGERGWLSLIVLPIAITTGIYFGFTEVLAVWLP